MHENAATRRLSVSISGFTAIHEVLRRPGRLRTDPMQGTCQDRLKDTEKRAGARRAIACV